MTERPRVVVMGLAEARWPEGAKAVAEVVDLAFATSSESLAEALSQAEILFAWPSEDRGMLPKAWGRAGRLRWIQTASDGVDWILFPQLVESHVVLTNARRVFDSAVAEYVLGLMLVFAKGWVPMLDRQRRHEWRRRDTELLAGKRLLVAGVGPIGRAIGRAGLALGMQVRGLGRSARPGDDVFERVHEAAELPQAAGWADYVVDVLPLTAETRGMFDAEVFAQMRPNARFVNVGRGATVDEGALVQALRDGRIAGAALDVFEEEPLPADSPLWDLPNVIVSPHVSGDFAGWREAVVELFLANLERYLTGQPLENVVDKRLGYVVEPRLR